MEKDIDKQIFSPYSECVHILCVELTKKIKIFLEDFEHWKPLSPYQEMLIKDIEHTLTELKEQMKVEDAEHHNLFISKKILEEYGKHK